ncbi:hypothetical protein OPV22_027997 [Ensete ventricosum]|uniref:Uncharacterized protein n=1 Tax=Ensete ventricosum TaxID=4639 RepID=A0AAV8Q1F8_ENSVE|nr:hypothetical protein OPV22_027997 [Ensete ventricosum]
MISGVNVTQPSRDDEIVSDSRVRSANNLYSMGGEDVPPSSSWSGLKSYYFEGKKWQRRASSARRRWQLFGAWSFWASPWPPSEFTVSTQTPLVL